MYETDIIKDLEERRGKLFLIELMLACGENRDRLKKDMEEAGTLKEKETC